MLDELTADTNDSDTIDISQLNHLSGAELVERAQVILHNAKDYKSKFHLLLQLSKIMNENDGMKLVEQVIKDQKAYLIQCLDNNRACFAQFSGDDYFKELEAHLQDRIHFAEKDFALKKTNHMSEAVHVVFQLAKPCDQIENTIKTQLAHYLENCVKNIEIRFAKYADEYLKKYEKYKNDAEFSWGKLEYEKIQALIHLNTVVKKVNNVSNCDFNEIKSTLKAIYILRMEAKKAALLAQSMAPLGMFGKKSKVDKLLDDLEVEPEENTPAYFSPAK